MAISAFSSVGRAGKENVIKTQALPQYFLLFPFFSDGLFQHPRPKEHWQQHEEISKASKASRLLLRYPSRPRPDMCGGY